MPSLQPLQLILYAPIFQLEGQNARRCVKTLKFNTPPGYKRIGIIDLPAFISNL